METAILLAATLALAALIATFWNKYCHAYGSSEWTKFYRRVAPTMNGKQFDPKTGMAWLTPHGTVMTHGTEFVITEYAIREGNLGDEFKLKAVCYKGTGDFNDEANYSTLEIGGLLRVNWSFWF